MAVRSQNDSPCPVCPLVSAVALLTAVRSLMSFVWALRVIQDVRYLQRSRALHHQYTQNIQVHPPIPQISSYVFGLIKENLHFVYTPTLK